MTLTEEIVEVAKRLIEFESIESRPGQLKAVIDFVEDYLKKNTKLNLKRFEVGEKPSLVATFDRGYPENRGNPSFPEVFFHDHLDVVPGDPAQFKPFIKGNKLYGRGASDTKGNGAVLMVLAKELSKQFDPRSPRLRESTDETPGVFPSPDVGFMFTTDEEIGGHKGTKYLLDKGYRCQFFVTAEPTSFNIIPAHKGILWLKIKVRGKAAHGSRPWDGENAALKAYRGLELFYEFYPTPTKPAWQTTVNLGGIAGGDAFNKVIGNCELKLDIRYIEKDKPAEILRRAKLSFPESEIEVVEEEPGMATPLTDPYVKRLAEVVKEVTGHRAEVHRGHGACDGRFYSRFGIPAVQFGTVSNGLHTDKEWLLINTLPSFYKILFKFALKIRKG